MHIKLSSRISLIVTLSSTTLTTSTSSVTNTNRNSINDTVIKVIKDSKEVRKVSFSQLQKCEAYDKWSLDNPGKKYILVIDNNSKKW